jgi:ribosomal protein L20A (L18A)
VKTFRITFSVGTSRHDEQRFTKDVKAVSLRGAAAHAYAIETRPNTTVVDIKLISEVYA